MASVRSVKAWQDDAIDEGWGRRRMMIMIMSGMAYENRQQLQQAHLSYSALV
jgi:hypothetical protein